MKLNKSLILAFVLLVVVAAIYRIIPSRPFGFAPQIAMAIFGGALIKDRKWAFALPIFSMFLSDLLYEGLHAAGITSMTGFYNGQTMNYLLIGLMTFVGFFIKKINVLQVGLASVVAPSLFFLLSNMGVWLFGGGWGHPFTLEGLLLTYKDGLPFYPVSVYSTLFFSVILFGGHYLLFRTKKIEVARS